MLERLLSWILKHIRGSNLLDKSFLSITKLTRKTKSLDQWLDGDWLQG